MRFLIALLLIQIVLLSVRSSDLFRERPNENVVNATEEQGEQDEVIEPYALKPEYEVEIEDHQGFPGS